MWPTWLVPLALLSNGTLPVGKFHGQSGNSSSGGELRNVGFSVDEVLLLNRYFIYFLAAIDDQAAADSADPQCALAMRQLATGYLARERLGLECEYRVALNRVISGR